MKIGVNARTFSVDEPGGAVQSAMRLTTELIENTEHDVVLFGSSSLSSDFDAEVISTGYIDRQTVGVVWERTVLPIAANRENIDVLYCPNGNAPPYKIGIPVVLCIHDVNAQDGWSSDVHQFYRRAAIPPAAQACDAIVTVSEFSKSEVTAQLGISDDKVNVIYNGVDEFYFGGSGNALDLPDRYLLFVGSLNPRKNITGVIEAFKLVSDEYDVDLVLIGPSNKGIFKQLDIGSASGVHQYGFLDIGEVKYAYEMAEVLVFPSFYEGFGLPPLESLASGTPVVASNRGALPEILGEAATFVEPESPRDIAEGISRILDGEKPDTSTMKSQAKQFTWGKVADRLVTTFSGVQ